MNHFPLPDGVEPYIIVPYKCTETYVIGDFMDYPYSKGWTRQQLLGHDNFGNRNPEEVEAFFQTWLYFGCMLEVFHAAGVRTTTEDFVEPATRAVTTKRLPELLLEWEKRWPKPPVSPKCSCSHWINPAENNCHHIHCWKRYTHGYQTHAYCKSIMILEEVVGFLDRYSRQAEVPNLETSAPFNIKPKCWPVGPEITVSICALVHTLSRAAFHIYDAPINGRPLRHKLSSSILFNGRLLRARWCPARVRITMDGLEIDGRYYIAARPEIETADHSFCTESGCIAKGLDEEKYTFRHVSGCSDCGSEGPPIADIINVIGRGGTPIVTWHGSGANEKHGFTVSEHLDKRIPVERHPVIDVNADGEIAGPLLYSSGTGSGLPVRARRGSLDADAPPLGTLVRRTSIRSIANAKKSQEQLMFPSTPHKLPKYVAISHVYASLTCFD
jgi:hypothetical protein